MMEKEEISSRKICSECDKQIADLQHYIEFGTYNAVDGWKILKLYREILDKRRDAKNKQVICEAVSKKKMSARYRQMCDSKDCTFNTKIIKQNFNVDKIKHKDQPKTKEVTKNLA